MSKWDCVKEEAFLFLIPLTTWSFLYKCHYGMYSFFFFPLLCVFFVVVLVVLFLSLKEIDEQFYWQ
jgi:hypothetical protein